MNQKPDKNQLVFDFKEEKPVETSNIEYIDIEYIEAEYVEYEWFF